LVGVATRHPSYDRNTRGRRDSPGVLIAGVAVKDGLEASRGDGCRVGSPLEGFAVEGDACQDDCCR
jgi:hypothetical protein